jgi:hypothetical protein
MGVEALEECDRANEGELGRALHVELQEDRASVGVHGRLGHGEFVRDRGWAQLACS